MEQETVVRAPSGLGVPAHAAGSTQIEHRSSISDPPTAIQKLPNEMLAAVFEAGARITLQDGGLPFILVVSHVCRHWRTTAYSFSDAWCYIPVHLEREIMTELFLSRSQGHPLEVCLYLGDFVTSRPIKDALKLIAPSTPRWTRFCVHARTSEDISPFKGHIRTLQDMVRLCAFELRIMDTSNYISMGGTANLLGMPLPPKLETIVCVGMSMDYWSPALRGLTRLTLENLMPPSSIRFLELCTLNPRLDYMRLVNTSPSRFLKWDGAFVLNSLRTLEFVLEIDGYGEEFEDSETFKYEDESYVMRFFNALFVPALQELSFRTNLPSAWEGFERTIVAGQDMLFQDLRVLRLEILQPATFYSSVLSTLLSTFPKLKELSFHTYHDGPAQHLLQEWISTMLEPMLPEIWPQLKTLAIRTPDDADNEMKDLLDLLESLRRSKGQPIEAWWESISATAA